MALCLLWLRRLGTFPSSSIRHHSVLALPWYLPRPHKLLLGFETCFYWASKLLRGTFWAPLKTLKTPAAAFEGLRNSKPSAAAFEGVPPALPWYLPRPHKLFLLGFETAFGHPLKASKPPQQLLSKALSQNPLPQLSKA